MKYTIENEKDVTILKIDQPKATFDTTKEFRKNIAAIIEENNWKKLVIDMSSVEFADSSFLGALITGLKKITSMQGDIRLFGLQAAVKTMVELTRLYRVFEIYNNKQEAINSY